MIILHHYPTSPWAEVVRLAFGLKGLSWGSVTIPVMMPKPRLMPLTGGYARTPVLQIGADIFCDTAAILDAIEQAHPTPSLYPSPMGQTHRLLAAQAQGATFFAAVGAAMGGLPAEGMEDFWEDREKRFGMKPEAFRAAAPHLVTQFAAHLALLEAALSDGRAFLGGADAGHADLAHYQLLWFQGARTGGDLSHLTGTRPHLGAWTSRVAAIGHGTPTEIDADEAIAAANAATPTIRGMVDPASGLKAGQSVAVSQEGCQDPAVEGTLAVLTDRRVSVLRTDPEAGDVAVHFPRIGQIVRPI
jgi:glutathione S-transferase